MKQYAVTIVVYLHAEDKNTAEMAADQMIDHSYLYGSRGESASIVEISEVRFTEEV